MRIRDLFKFVLKYDPEQPRIRTGKWTLDGIGSKDFHRQLMRKTAEADGHAAGMRAATQLLSRHHHGDGSFHGDAQTKLRAKIENMGTPNIEVPFGKDSHKGYADALKKVYRLLKAHIRRVNV